MVNRYDTIGQPVRRAEGPEKVTGSALYAADLNPPGTLVGKCLRSPYPYARILSIDTSAARRLPGVYAVLTSSDISDALVGRMIRDMPVLARDVVRFAGQKVAAVAAEDTETADEAISLIEVEYEEMGPILDPLAAMRPDAPVIHPDFMDYVGRDDSPQELPNVVAHDAWKKGDIDLGFAEADFVFEHTFRTPHQHQGYIEPHAVLVSANDGERAQVWASTKMPFQVRQQMAEGTGLTEDDIRLNPCFIGGDFGGKGGFMDTHVAYWLSRAAGRPVRVVMSYIEELMAGNPRHPAVMTLKTGVKKDGTITARSAHLVFDGGAYSTCRPMKRVSFGTRCLGPYRMAHAQIDAYMVYTNHVPCGAMRAPGDPQSIFAGEAQIDLVARELGIDPYEFRMKNLVEDGDESPLGQHWRNVLAKETLAAAAQEVQSNQPKSNVPGTPGKRLGRAFSVSERHVGSGTSTAKVEVDIDGSVTLYTALPDTGTGFYTVLRQIVGQELGVPYDQVRLVPWSTDDTGFNTGAGGSRVTHVTGQAVYIATLEVRGKLAALASDLFGWAEDEVSFREGHVTAPGQRSMSLADLASKAGGPVEAEATYVGERNEDLTSFCAQAADVEVDEETGEVRLVRFTTAHDVGTILNPMAHQGQIEGAVMQGVGFALMEELRYEDGRVSTLSFGEYKMPTISDIPELRTVLVPSAAGGPTPYGGKAIGEMPISGVAPAIANAVLDAVGVSIADLPITAEKVYFALRERE